MLQSDKHVASFVFVMRRNVAIFGLVGTILFFTCAYIGLISQTLAQLPATESAKKSAEFDPFTVPETDVKGLFDFIHKLQEWQPNADPDVKKNPEKMKKLRAEVQRVYISMATAADKLLTQKLTEEQRAEATMTRWGAVRTQLMIKPDKETDTRFLKLTEEMAKDPNPQIAGTAQRMLLMGRLQHFMSDEVAQPGKMPTDSPQAVVQDVLKLAFGTPAKPVEPENLELVSETGSMLEMIGQYQLAIQLQTELVKAVGQVRTQEAQEAKMQAELALRRLGLIGKPITITGKTFAGAPFDATQYRGKVVLIDFWATWCGPCRAELPNVLNNYKKYHDKGFEVVGISLDNEPEKLKNFLQEQQIPWEQLVSDNPQAQGFDDPLVKQFGVHGIPATYLIDKQGNVIHINARGPRLGKLLAEALGEVK